MTDRTTGTIVGFDDLDHTEHSHDFVGAEHGEVPFSVILVHSRPGVGRSCIATRIPRYSSWSRGRPRSSSASKRSWFDTEWLAGNDPVWTSKNTGMTAAAHHVDSEAP